MLLAILRGEYHLRGLSNRLLQRVRTGKRGGQISRVLKRLRLHGLIKQIAHTYKYYVTALANAPSSPPSNSRNFSSFPPS